MVESERLEVECTQLLADINRWRCQNECLKRQNRDLLMECLKKLSKWSAWGIGTTLNVRARDEKTTAQPDEA